MRQAALAARDDLDSYAVVCIPNMYLMSPGIFSWTVVGTIGAMGAMGAMGAVGLQGDRM